ncbi:MAG: hypothetical protein R3F11_17865 [Verrucomicrobiales bacterium]
MARRTPPASGGGSGGSKTTVGGFTTACGMHPARPTRSGRSLDAGGNFVSNSAIREIIVPLLSPAGTSPVSDITFSEGGSMFFASAYRARTTPPVCKSALYACRVFEYTGSSGSWTPHPTNVYKPGWLNHVLT